MRNRFDVQSLIVLLSIPALAVMGCGNGGQDPSNPCDGIICDEPPPPNCDGNEIVSFADSGTCEDGDCVYPEVGREVCDEAPPASCDGDEVVIRGAGVCEEGACLYPELEREICDDPPSAYCDGEVEVTFAPTGVCDEGECYYPEHSRTACEDIAHVCDPNAGVCVDPCEDVSCPPLDTWCEDDVLMMLVGHCDWQTGQCVYEEVATELPGCGFGYNFDFEVWSDGFPEGFVMHPTGGFSISEEASEVNTGQRSALLETSVGEARYLRASMPFEFLEQEEVYTFHVWYRFGRVTGEAGAYLQPWMEVADASDEVEPGWVLAGPRITEEAHEWREVTFTTPPMTADRAFLRPFVEMRGLDAWAHVDDWAVTMPITRNLNSRRDLDSLVFLFNGNYWVASGIDNRGVIYPSARSADVDNGWDQMLFTWVGRPCDSLVSAPWDKDGMVAGPGVGGVLLALLQSTTGHCEWQRYDPEADTWSVLSSHVDCSNRVGDPAGLNYALEGVLDLVAHLDGVDSPAEVPTWFHFAASHWTSGAGGTLVPLTQAPASRNDDGNIDANETHRAHRATFLSGKVTYYYP